MSRYKVAVLATHPIQYHAQWYRALALDSALDLRVLYCHKSTPKDQAGAGFGVEFDWDVPLLDGYDHRFLRNVSREPSPDSFFGLDTPEIRSLIAEGQYDAVMVNGWHYKSAWQAIRTCWRHGIPVLVRSDSHLGTERRLVTKLIKALPYRWFISRLDACLPVGRWSADYFLHYGARPDRVFRVPHVIDETRFVHDANQLLPLRDQLRHEWRLCPEALVFLFVGKFVAGKRPMEFLQAIRVAHKRCTKVSGLMTGEGPMRSACEQFVRENALPVQFTGFLNQSEIVRAYAASDVLVLPSDSETWGVVVNEAMTCGRCCIVSDQVGCGPDLVIEGKTGDVFPVGNVAALANLLETYAANPERVKAMGAMARERMRAYSVSEAVSGVIAAVGAVTKAGA